VTQLVELYRVCITDSSYFSGGEQYLLRIMNTGIVASVLWFLIALGLAVSSALAENATQALLWGVVAIIAVIWTAKMRDVSGPAQV
jgi:hypothetical protein